MTWIDAILGKPEAEWVRKPDHAFLDARFQERKLRDLRADAYTVRHTGPTVPTVAYGSVDALMQKHPGALFQMASQCNYLEMAYPDITPEQGIGIYQYDQTQGPCVAMATPGAALFRNYWVNGWDQANGMSEWLSVVGKRRREATRWNAVVRNGYFLPTKRQLLTMVEVMEDTDMQHIKMGTHADCRVHGTDHTVDLAICYAAPIGYSEADADTWEPLAKQILNAQYEATLIHATLTNPTAVFLTRLGGGVFANPGLWIDQAIDRAMQLVRPNLPVYLVEYE